MTVSKSSDASPLKTLFRTTSVRIGERRVKMNSFILLDRTTDGRRCVVEFYVLLATISLVLQIVTLLVLALGITAKFLGRLFLHGSVMLAAVIIHAISFLLAMGPSLFSLVNENRLFSSLSTEMSAIILTHVGLGITAEILGIWLVLNWRFRSPSETCARRKPIMRSTLAFWVSALFLGVWIYFLLYSGLI
jgi:uncharacterized membrane protein YozB (DUF420 family)